MTGPTLTDCWVLLEDDRRPGRVLRWWREGSEWHAVVRFRAPGPGGYLMNYESRLPAESVRPRHGTVAGRRR